ncbi:hypothetical protein [Streptomyces sp. P9-A2]|uniref:hypothetical protein n=1 Tax=Streptomyces sp. P9-A2 TaxID=3072284 RepID=UPI002FC8E97D
MAATARVGAGRTEEEQDAVSSQVIKGVGLVAAEVARRASTGGEKKDGSGAKDGAGDATDGAGATSGTRDTGGPEGVR